MYRLRLEAELLWENEGSGEISLQKLSTDLPGNLPGPGTQQGTGGHRATWPSFSSQSCSGWEALVPLHMLVVFKAEALRREDR